MSLKVLSIKRRKSLDTIKTFGINWDKPFRNQTPKTRFYDELKGVKMGLVNAGDGIGHHQVKLYWI